MIYYITIYYIIILIIITVEYMYATSKKTRRTAYSALRTL